MKNIILSFLLCLTLNSFSQFSDGKYAPTETYDTVRIKMLMDLGDWYNNERWAVVVAAGWVVKQLYVWTGEANHRDIYIDTDKFFKKDKKTLIKKENIFAYNQIDSDPITSFPF